MAKPKPARTGPSLGQEVIALAILGSGILLLLALFSFDPRDLTFNGQSYNTSGTRTATLTIS